MRTSSPAKSFTTSSQSMLKTGYKFFTRSRRQKDDVDHIGQKSDIQVFYEAPDFKKDDPKWVEFAPPTLPIAKKKQHEGAAVQVYKRRNVGLRREGFYIYKVRLQSPYLRDVLQDTLETYGISFKDNVYAESTAPHRGLFFSLDRIAELAKTAEDDTTRRHCELLSNVVEEVFDSALDELEILSKAQKITFDLLWTLFPEGSLFASQGDASPPYAFRVKNINQEERFMDLKYEYVMFDGFRFGTIEKTLRIPAFEGAIDVSAIPDFRYVNLSQDNELRTRLLERGKKVLDMQAIHYMNYKPKTSGKKIAGSPMQREEEVQRVVVDHYLCRVRKRFRMVKPLPAYAKLFGEEDAEAEEPLAVKSPPREDGRAYYSQGNTFYQLRDVSDGSSYSYGGRGRYGAEQLYGPEITRRPTEAEIERNRRAALESEDYLIVMNQVLGYSLDTRTWTYFHIDYVHPIEVNHGVFEKVVLDETKKDVLRTLVESHMDMTATHYDDLIVGKGQCLLVILSGPPGTGKTLVAESLAEHLVRPLLRADPDYISNALDQVIDGYEANLRQFLEDAREWGALVLFDEPDFLFQNQESGADRKELLAFLRYAEYFKGIIILTTNLGRTIDPAVISRAQVHIRFPALTEPMRVRVWENFIERLPKEIGTLGKSEVAQLATWRVNGREIKNILNMSVSWCRRKQCALSIDIIENLIVTICPTAKREHITGTNGSFDDHAGRRGSANDFLLDI